MVPGPYDTDHESGDDWVADAALKVMENEDWSALNLNFSGIDKIGHMWGGGAWTRSPTTSGIPHSIMT